MRNSKGFLEVVLDKHLEGFYLEYKKIYTGSVENSIEFHRDSEGIL